MAREITTHPIEHFNEIEFSSELFNKPPGVHVVTHVVRMEPEDRFGPTYWMTVKATAEFQEPIEDPGHEKAKQFAKELIDVGVTKATMTKLAIQRKHYSRRKRRKIRFI